MKKADVTKAAPIARAVRPRGVNRQTLVKEDRERRRGNIRTESESLVAGVIVDSWVESGQGAGTGARLVLQVAPTFQTYV